MSAPTLITTTVHVPEALRGYASDAGEHGRTVKIYVAGERGTSAGSPDYCAWLAKDTGIECEYPGLAAQDAFLSPWPALHDHLPWNCIQRLDHNFFLAPGARGPFNSQNTILARAVLPAYFLSPNVGRYDDIFASFMVKRIADHLGWGALAAFFSDYRIWAELPLRH